MHPIISECLIRRSMQLNVKRSWKWLALQIGSLTRGTKCQPRVTNQRAILASAIRAEQLRVAEGAGWIRTRARLLPAWKEAPGGSNPVVFAISSFMLSLKATNAMYASAALGFWCHVRSRIN